MHFNELNLSQELIMAVNDLGYEEMTEIQSKSIPLLLEGADVIGRSNTGTGKTAAFGIPAVESIESDMSRFLQVLILCPTRELAMQACDELKKFAKYKKWVKPVAVYGGASMEKQIYALKRGGNIVVGTPGRVMDHIRRRTLKLDNIKTVILDEADEMLNMGFREDIESILNDIPHEHQTVLFSATMPPEIMNITKKYQNDPVVIKIAAKYKTVDLIQQFCFEVAMGRKTDALKLLLAAYQPKSSMVFCNTKKMVDELTEALLGGGFKAVGLHGDMKQSQRTQVMNSFKSGAVSILVATDVAARGIDVNGIDAVFNYDIPQDNEYYIHRIGRTGRAGHTGVAYTLVSGRRQLNELKDISRYTKAEITQMELPEKDDIIDIRLQSIKTDITELLSENISESAYELVENLENSGISPKQIAAALINKQLKEVMDSLPEFDIPKPIRRGKNKPAVNTVKVDISIGRNQRIAPNFILGALVDATGMSGREFGKIDIFDKHTTVEVPESESDYVIDAMNFIKINGHQVEVKLYEGKGKSTERRFDRDKNDNRRKRFDKFKSAGRKRPETHPERKRHTKKRH
ncbi:MAG: DEAD/DEAH box helicase [Ruminococcus sp.]|jgi:ATP-dependent RNA helicase DeaD|nr:DEAD/DEAH box helicase [Ruminococcus sp.]MBQ7008648.1 DEAD/DEAH box helicase [Ruminococcus sp.]